MSDKVAPGWYPRPDMAGTQGYWDGEKWSEQVAPMAPKATPQSGDVAGEIAGWVGAFVFPILGLAIGGVMLSRGQGRGAGMIALSIASILVILGVMNH